MTLWTSAEAAAATGGRASGDWAANGVSIDSRSLVAGDLFVALTDARDGHDFVAGALAGGAAAAMVSRIPDGVAADAPLLVVDDVLRGLAALATAARARSRARVVAVTGSAGKTSTKDMLRHVLSAQGETHAAEKSFNNHWGVPLTLARLPQGADFAVIEIGMNHPGEIGPLAALARPHVAVVTTVAPAHLEAFADVAAIAREKAAIFDGLEPGGTAVINGDLPQTPILRQAALARAGAVLDFGEGAANAVRLVGLQADADGLRASVAAPGAGLAGPLRLVTPGRHFAMNALAALGAVSALGADAGRARAALAGWVPPDGRGRTEALQIGERRFTLIDDAFNANPASMAAGLAMLGAVTPGPGGRRVAVLGDMLELGADEEALHVALDRDPAMASVAVVHCVGPRMGALHAALPAHRRGLRASTAAEIAAVADALVRDGDVLLVKGSKGSRVSEVVDALKDLGHRPAQATRKALNAV